MKKFNNVTEAKFCLYVLEYTGARRSGRVNLLDSGKTGL